MQCLHGLGISHVIVDALMLVPFAGVFIVWIKSLKSKRSNKDDTTRH